MAAGRPGIYSIFLRTVGRNIGQTLGAQSRACSALVCVRRSCFGPKAGKPTRTKDFSPTHLSHLAVRVGCARRLLILGFRHMHVHVPFTVPERGT